MLTLVLDKVTRHVDRRSKKRCGPCPLPSPASWKDYEKACTQLLAQFKTLKIFGKKNDSRFFFWIVLGMEDCIWLKEDNGSL
jgi:hypothetical protein